MPEINIDKRQTIKAEKYLMSNLPQLPQAAVKLILNALQSTNLTIESFVIMATSTEPEECMHPLSRSFLDGGIEILLDQLVHKLQHPFQHTKPEQL